MNITLKPLTVYVEKINNTASITIKNDQGAVVLGPLTHHALDTKHDWQESINDHIAQLVHRDMNIVNLVTRESGIRLPTQE